MTTNDRPIRDVNAGSIEGLSITGDLQFRHVFYERDGQRYVELAEALARSSQLWLERLSKHPEATWDSIKQCIRELNARLLPYSRASKADQLRYLILRNEVVPDHWRGQEPYPHKDMLIAGVLLDQASHRLSRGDESSGWHLLATANIYLGHALHPTKQEISSERAKHRTILLDSVVCNLVIVAIRLLAKKSKLPLTDKKDIVRGAIADEFNKHPTLQKMLEEALSSAEPGTSDSRSRLDGLIGKWTKGGSPYPLVFEAFQHLTGGGKSSAVKAQEFFADLERAEFGKGIPVTDSNLAITCVYAESRAARTYCLIQPNGRLIDKVS